MASFTAPGKGVSFSAQTVPTVPSIPRECYVVTYGRKKRIVRRTVVPGCRKRLAGASVAVVVISLVSCLVGVETQAAQTTFRSDAQYLIDTT